MNSRGIVPPTILLSNSVALARLPRHEADLRVAVLAAPAGLLDVAPLALGGPRERLLVGHLGLADAGLDAELALQPIDDDLEVQLAHAPDHHLARLDGPCSRGRSGPRPCSLARPWASFSWSALVLRLDRQRDDRLREVHRLEHDRVLLVADRVAGGHAPEPDGGRDVARVDLLDLLTLVGVHLQEAAHALRACPWSRCRPSCPRSSRRSRRG